MPSPSAVPRSRRPSALLACLAVLAACAAETPPPAVSEPRASESAPSDLGASGVPAAPLAFDPTPVRIQLNWFPEPEFGGLYAARERRIFADRGVNIELLSGGADVPAPQLVASGKVEMGVLAAEQLLTLRAAGGAAKALFAAFQRAPRVIIVKADSPHATLESLWTSKATILAQDGMAFIRYLNRRFPGGQLSFVPYAGSAAPLIAGSVDAMQGFATAEPIQLELDGVAVRPFLVADAGYAPYDSVLVVNEEFLAREPAKVAAVVAAVADGWRAYLADPGPTNAIMAELNRDMSAEVMAKSAALLPSFLESDDTRAHGIGWMDAGRWATLGQQLVELGELSAPIDTAAAFVNLETPPAPAPAAQ